MNRANELEREAGQVAQTVLRQLPAPIREQLAHVAVTLLPRPTPEMIADQLEPDLLGLFVGDAFAEESSDPLPAEILLFLDNIWDYADHQHTLFREEVRRTLLHEIGHYLGCDEDDLTARDLD